MAKSYILLALILALTVLVCEARQLTRCQLVKELRKHGFPENQMRNWVCLVEHESGRNTNKRGSLNKNGSRDYGLFQINDKYWCTKTGAAGKDCHVTCADVSKNDITKAATCAKKIFKRHGFNAWYGWKNHCQGALPNISSC